MFIFLVSLYKETFVKLRISIFGSVGLLGLVTLAFRFIFSLGGIGGPEKDLFYLVRIQTVFSRGLPYCNPSFEVVPPFLQASWLPLTELV